MANPPPSTEPDASPSPPAEPPTPQPSSPHDQPRSDDRRVCNNAAGRSLPSASTIPHDEPGPGIYEWLWSNRHNENITIPTRTCRNRRAISTAYDDGFCQIWSACLTNSWSPCLTISLPYIAVHNRSCALHKTVLGKPEDGRAGGEKMEAPSEQRLVFRNSGSRSRWWTIARLGARGQELQGSACRKPPLPARVRGALPLP
jgi:hypothetical protein